MSGTRLRTLIVDDEKPARARLKRLLLAHPEIEVIGETADGLSALAEIARLAPELVFLDIEMPELDGIGVARSLGLAGPAIVFVTAYDTYALQAFEANALDYVLKPIAAPRLKQAVDKLLRRRGHVAEPLRGFRPDAPFAVRAGAKFVVCVPKKIAVILAQDHYSTILMEGRELLADEPLDLFEARLDPEQFMRVHRSALVNFSFIQELEREGDRKYVAVLSDAKKTRVAISRERLDEVKTRFGLI